MAFQPRMEEPSKASPSEKELSSISSEATVRCCHLPWRSVNFKFPKDVKIQVEKQTVIKINGVDKELVSKIASDIKSLKPVEPYKGKGIKERNQYVLRKEGKKK